ncbi:hypothetical protein BFP72_15070 [Reichenbachiella sp. 5M10]|uniref:hypothetical protein n=1 Tax=Reichenbachiella sp. 5M10 TaxID=1889772 RepID=UPI000C15144F|nr:hypothetical protein [Reichenbachiella sp. 5M10]PIB36626.1 hypothetical protein BFP72_15070 [Reichenbachiella sp. 5M10]
MKSKLGLVVGIVGVLTLWFSCEEVGKDDPILVFLEPSEASLEVNSNEFVQISLEAYSSNGVLTEMVIDQTDDYFGFVNLVDSIISSEKLNYQLNYRVPEYPDSTVVLLTFTVSDDQKNTARIAKTIQVNRTATFIKASSGHTMYSAQSEDPSAFSLMELSPKYLADSLDAQLDFVELTSDVTPDVLSYDWGSRSGISFVKFNDFNYPAATSISIRNAYQGGTKRSMITNIEDSDVYLFGREGVAFGALQMVAIVDAEGALNDKYVFNLKLISGVDLEQDADMSGEVVE